VHQKNFPSQSGNKPTKKAREREDKPKKGPFQCWGCGEPHMLKDYPHSHHDGNMIYCVQEATKINDVSTSMPRIYVAVENQQADHQVSVVELKGIAAKQPIYILIDPTSNLSYISCQIV
jgi:hypothetical protein